MIDTIGYEKTIGRKRIRAVPRTRRAFRRWVIFSALALFAGLIPSAAWADRIHKVLVIHSYHQGLAWTDSVSEGIRTVFAPFDKRVELYFDYLDIKRRDRPDPEAALTPYLGSAAAFDVAIVADDEAFDLVRRRQAAGGLDLPLVFCGVSRFDPAMSPPAAAITGVLKTHAHRDNLKLMSSLHKQSKRLILLFDWHAAGTPVQKELSDIVKNIPSHLTVDIWPNQSLDELPARLQGLDADDLIYMLAVNRDKDLNYLFSNEAVRLVARWSPAPVYSPVEAYMGEGIVGGRITSGFSQGELAAQLALRIISGEPAGSIPIISRSANPYIFDYRQLKRFGVKTADLPDHRTIIGQPAPFTIRWKKTILIISAASLLAALLMLGGIVRLQKKHQALLRTRAELDIRLNEKSVHLQLLHQKIKKRALTDALTGLANRRSILTRCAEEMKRAQRYGTAFAIAILDLDDFKRINTEFGYVVGDRILKDIAHTIGHGIREIDMVGRFSGEAFLILLPNTDLSMALRATERILAAVAALHWEQMQVRTTLSIGLVAYSGQGLPELIAMAEDLQHNAKARGGNRIATAATAG